MDNCFLLLYHFNKVVVYKVGIDRFLPKPTKFLITLLMMVFVIMKLKIPGIKEPNLAEAEKLAIKMERKGTPFAS